MAVGEEFYFYRYPFFSPSYFLTYQNKYDLEIKMQLIESFSTVELEKRFPVKFFLNQFSIPNKDLTKIESNALIGNIRECIDKLGILLENFFCELPNSGKFYLASKGVFLALNITNVQSNVFRYILWSSATAIQLFYLPATCDQNISNCFKFFLFLISN
jgi:hypothetical protein